MEYLYKFGYLDVRTESQTSSQSPNANFEDPVQYPVRSSIGNNFKTALEKFQEMAGLPQSGEFDASTQAKMTAPRCGTPDRTPSGSKYHERRSKRFILSGIIRTIKTLSLNNKT